MKEEVIRIEKFIKDDLYKFAMAIVVSLAGKQDANVDLEAMMDDKLFKIAIVSLVMDILIK